MNDMFKNLKELKHKLKLEETKTVAKNIATTQKQVIATSSAQNTQEKEKRLVSEFKQFLEDVK